MIQNNEYRLGTVVQLKKSHPSQTKEWEVTYLGSDIKLKSLQKKGLYIIFSRTKFNKSVQVIVKF